MHGFGGLDGFGAVEQWLAAEPLGDFPCLAYGRRRGLGIAVADQVIGVVEQAVGKG